MTKTIIVTGASRGIGLAIVRYLVTEGHNVIATARSKTSLENLQEQNPNRIRTVVGDMIDPAIGHKLIDTAVKEFGGLDGLVINHGIIAPIERVGDAQVDQWRHNFDINFFSAVAIIEKALPALRQAEQGRVIFTSSGAASHSYSAWGPYCASKAALKSLAETLSTEEKNITAVSIRPGVVDTEMQNELREKHLSVLDEVDQKRFSSLKEEGKLLAPEKPGHVIARLAINASRQLSGQFLSWDDVELASYQDAD